MPNNSQNEIYRNHQDDHEKDANTPRDQKSATQTGEQLIQLMKDAQTQRILSGQPSDLEQVQKIRAALENRAKAISSRFGEQVPNNPVLDTLQKTYQGGIPTYMSHGQDSLTPTIDYFNRKVQEYVNQGEHIDRAKTYTYNHILNNEQRAQFDYEQNLLAERQHWTAPHTMDPQDYLGTMGTAPGAGPSRTYDNPLQERDTAATSDSLLDIEEDPAKIERWRQAASKAEPVDPRAVRSIAAEAFYSVALGRAERDRQLGKDLNPFQYQEGDNLQTLALAGNPAFKHIDRSADTLAARMKQLDLKNSSPAQFDTSRPPDRTRQNNISRLILILNTISNVTEHHSDILSAHHQSTFEEFNNNNGNNPLNPEDMKFAEKAMEDYFNIPNTKKNIIKGLLKDYYSIPDATISNAPLQQPEVSSSDKGKRRATDAQFAHQLQDRDTPPHASDSESDHEHPEPIEREPYTKQQLEEHILTLDEELKAGTSLRNTSIAKLWKESVLTEDEVTNIRKKALNLRDNSTIAFSNYTKIYNAAYYASPVNKAKKAAYEAAYYASPVNKAKKSERATAYQARPEIKAKNAAYYARPEIKAKRAERDVHNANEKAATYEQVLDFNEPGPSSHPS